MASSLSDLQAPNHQVFIYTDQKIKLCMPFMRLTALIVRRKVAMQNSENKPLIFLCLMLFIHSAT
jgi:hypothetical protein